MPMDAAEGKDAWEDNVTDGMGERIRPAAVRSGGYRDHLGRYLFAGHFVAGRSAVDLCCGHGYGANLLLAAGAVRVRGIDIAAETIAAARSQYPGAEFAVGRVDAPLDLRTYDVAICFEGIEHVTDPDQLLDNMRAAEVALVSSPNAAFSPGGFSGNPHHLREWTRDAFEALLRRHFVDVRMYFQWHHPDPLDLDPGVRGIAKAVLPNRMKHWIGERVRTLPAPDQAIPPSPPQAGSHRANYRVHRATYLWLPRVLPGLRYGEPGHWIAVCQNDTRARRRARATRAGEGPEQGTA